MKKYLFLVFLPIVFISCSSDDPGPTDIPDLLVIPDCNAPALIEKRIFIKNNKKYLWAGQDSSWAFNITGWGLDECRLSPGVGREFYPALIEPQYSPIQDFNYDDKSLCIVLKGNNVVKVYPFTTMLNHQVVNERIDKENVMIVYSVLANLAGVYSREYCRDTLTFAPVGYDYFDPDVWGGLEAFILWDRETESLWWPLSNLTIAGPIKDLELELHTAGKWEELMWSEVKNTYPNALVLKENQTMDVPLDWRKILDEDIVCN